MPFIENRPISDLSGDVHFNMLPEEYQPIFNSMSDLLSAAVADARGLDRKRYNPCSDEWHDGIAVDQCQVCLAGAFIAGTLEFQPSFDIRPSMFTHPMHDKLLALDAMRSGDWEFAFLKFYSCRPRPDTLDALLDLPDPDDSDFYSWEEFDHHLNSLESIIPELRRIEERD